MDAPTNWVFVAGDLAGMATDRYTEASSVGAAVLYRVRDEGEAAPRAVPIQ